MGKRHVLGRNAEEAVADYLFVRGFQVLGANLRVGHLEIDLVARKARLLAIVEVRTRGPTSFQGPFASISVSKRKRLLAASEGLLHGRLVPLDGVERVRIDVASVVFEKGKTAVEYLEGAVVRDESLGR